MTAKKEPPKTIKIEGISIYDPSPPAEIIAPAIIPMVPKNL